MTGDEDGLTPKRRRFVEEYLKDLNATQAAIRAGYSPRTANEQGSQLLANLKVSAAVAEAMEKRSKATGITVEWVLERTRREAEFEGEGASHSARVAALTLAAKHLGMLVERVKADVSVTERPQIVEYPVRAEQPPATDRALPPG